MRIKPGSTDQAIDVFIADTSSTNGQSGLTGLVFNTSGLTCYYRRGATGTMTQLTLATQTVGGAHSDGGFVEIDATNAKGLYRLDLSDTIIAAGVPYVTIYLSGATNMADTSVEVELDDGDNLAAIPWNSDWDAEVQSECDDALVGRLLHLLMDVPLPTDWTDITPNSALDHLAANSSEGFDRSLHSLKSQYDALRAARSEPPKESPAENADLLTKIDYLYKYLINNVEQDQEFTKLYNFAGTVVDQQRPITDTGPSGKTTRGKLVIGS